MDLLLVEDDELLGAGIQAALEQEEYRVAWARSAEEAEAEATRRVFDLMVLDLGLPDRDGLALLRELRARGFDGPVLVLTARDAVSDRVAGLDSGADDYMVKPFDLDELAARLRALVRRRGGRGSARTRLGPLTLDAASHRVTLRGERIELTRSEFAILHALVQNVGKVLSRQELEAAVHGTSEAVESNAVEVHIHHLRRKLGRQFISTVRGVGYMVDRPARQQGAER